jgi:MFS transporter, SP family, sugar:H+ symporter
MGNTYNYLVSFAAAMGGLLFGYEIGVIGQVLGMDSFGLHYGMKFQNETGVFTTSSKDDLEGNITFTFLAGCVLGAMLVSVMADSIGRKWSIFVGGLFFAGGGIVQSAVSDLVMFYVGRVISGFGIGILSMVVPLFISETAATEVRGRMVTVQQLMITIGIFIATVINAVIIVTMGDTGDTEWRVALAIQVLPGVILLLLVALLPYSPRWLADKGRDSEAIVVLARLRGSSPDAEIVQREYREIRDSVELERQVGSASWPELFKAGIVNRLMIAVVLQFFQQWTGINVILYYSKDLFEAMGFDPKAAAIPFSIANSFINFLATFPGMYLVERLGRRKLLIIGGFGMAMAHFSTCLWVGLSKNGCPPLAWLAIVSVYFFFFCVSTLGTMCVHCRDSVIAL